VAATWRGRQAEIGPAPVPPGSNDSLHTFHFSLQCPSLIRVTSISLRVLGYGAALFLMGAPMLSAQRATQTVTFHVEAIDQIAVQGAPALTIATAAAGQAPTSVTATGSTWNVTTNQTGSRITASLASDMPTGLTLSVSLGAPSGATSAGLKVLGTAPVEVISNLTKIAAAGLPLTYQLDAVPAAGVVTTGARVVIFTITGGT
jgi:hypothetical protein